MTKIKGLKVEPPRPTVIEPTESRVLAAMKAFPEAVMNGGSFWGGPLATSEREWHATLSRMADVLSCDDCRFETVNGCLRGELIAESKFTENEAIWAVYRLAERGLLLSINERTNDGELFWWTTPALWKWMRAETPLEARHSSDFASVNWFGVAHTFTTNQANCVRLLWTAWKNKTPTMSGTTIIDEAGVDRTDERLDLVFRDNLAWGTMIVSDGKGRYRLADPEFISRQSDLPQNVAQRKLANPAKKRLTKKRRRAGK